jgi:hypothetical protein
VWLYLGEAQSFAFFIGVMGHVLIYIFMKLAEVEKLMVAAIGGW